MYILVDAQNFYIISHLILIYAHLILILYRYIYLDICNILLLLLKQIGNAKPGEGD